MGVFIATVIAAVVVGGLLAVLRATGGSRMAHSRTKGRRSSPASAGGEGLTGGDSGGGWWSWGDSGSSSDSGSGGHSCGGGSSCGGGGGCGGGSS
ncbi:hypothetical protein [Streptomyces globisporus]